MNVITGIKLYIEKMCTESGPGMKTMLLDKDTVGVTAHIQMHVMVNFTQFNMFLIFVADQYHFDGIFSIRHVAA